MAFINARLLEGVAYGTSYGTGFRTNIKTLRSGRERRDGKWSAPRGRFSIIYTSLLPEDHERALSAFQACMGRLHSFRLQDLTDYRASQVQIGIGTGAAQALQLVRRYGFGAAGINVPVTRPVAGTVTVYADGAPVAATVDYTTGQVTFIADEGAIITWSGEYDKVVRFDDDELQFSIDSRAGGLVPLLSADVSLQEVFE